MSTHPSGHASRLQEGLQVGEAPVALDAPVAMDPKEQTVSPSEPGSQTVDFDGSAFASGVLLPLFPCCRPCNWQPVQSQLSFGTDYSVCVCALCSDSSSGCLRS